MAVFSSRRTASAHSYTPAHGTAFDIVGENVASPKSAQNALDIAIVVASKKAANRSATIRSESLADKATDTTATKAEVDHARMDEIKVER